MKKRIISMLLTLCMVMTMLPTTGLSTSASSTEELIDSSIGVDGKALISTNVSIKDQYYAVLGKSGVVTPTATTGTGTSSKGWYQATSAGAISFSGIDPAQSPFQIVTSSNATSAPDGTATSVSGGTKLGNLIYYYYVANSDTTDGIATIGSDDNAGTKAAPFATIQRAVDQVNTITNQQQGVVVLLDDSTISDMIGIPLYRDGLTQNDAKNITITSDGAQHKIIRNFDSDLTSIETYIGSRLVLDNVTMDDNHKHNAYSTVFVDPYCTMILRGNSKLINGANRAVNVRANGTFIMESGEISGNTANQNIQYLDNYTGIANAGGGVYICASNKDGMVGGTFIMTGGKITNNKASVGAAGIFGEAGTTIKISGDAVVTGNTNTATSAPSNIYLNNNQKITLSGPLSDDANLGVYVTNMPGENQPDVPIATGDGTYVPTSSDVRAFASDQATTAGVKLSSNEIVMSNAAKANNVTVSGTVSDYVGGKNTLSGISVSLYDAEDTNFTRQLGTATTDASGKYTMSTSVKNGNYRVKIGEKAGCYGSCWAPVTVDSATVSNANLTLTKYTQAFVHLNKPVFNNDESGYSFKSAFITNFTGVNSITFSITKGTTVKSVSSFLTPTSKLESINGDTRTFTYVYKQGITVSQAEEFIRGIVFNYVAGAEVSITVDNNVTNLPDGAKITKFAHPDGTDHYYMFVPFADNSHLLTWQDSYNAAKTYRYMGRIGYLATITSDAEDKVLDNISMAGGWSGGSRYTNVSDGATAPAGATDANFKWSCGQECGTNYYYYSSANDKHAVNSAYNGFKVLTEPNNYKDGNSCPITSGDNEWCMQVHHKDSGIYTWNDLSNTVGINGTTNLPEVTGYFVEFSNYAGGMDSLYSSAKTAVGTYNLATDGGVEDVATVTLNAPVYGSNKSEFSFTNAELTNISTVTSLTIKLDNYTNVLSKPGSPVPTKELSNIAGTANTITYLFGDGITQADAQSFLKGLKFRYGGLKASSSTNVSVTVDGNKTNLPTGANITEFNGHYYIYVNDNLSWTDAYNKAKTYRYMGLIGYLATITSAQEDKVLDNISMNGAWSAGTRHTGNYDLATAPNGTSVNNSYFIWACGPEAGTKYYNNNTTPVNGAYNGFYDTNEPNGSINLENSECCMQVHYKGNSSSPMTWNDLSDRIYNGSGTEPTVGYFVEFSDYDGGRVDGYSQSASGASTVPIAVEKGDVFNTVKDGGTYYVDTKLTAFDRNITSITVNNNAFTSGNKLPGNTNTTYTIKATDLEGNTATTTVTMKTIASISEPIKDLTVNNVQMSNKDNILAVKAALMAIDQTDASDAQKTEIANTIKNCKDLYFALFHATATAANGTNGWYKSGGITLAAPDGFEISTSNTGTWSNFITVDNADGANKTAPYYLKETSTGDISGTKTFNYKVDTTAPSNPTVSYGKDNFKEFLNTLTFGLFFKDTVTVTLTATDTGSGVKEFKYTIDKTEYTAAATSGSATFTVPSPYKGNLLGVKAIDNAGNESGVKATEYFAVDNQKPTAPTVDANGYPSDTWTKNDVKITASGASATSEIAKYQYSTDNGKTWSDMTTTEKIDATDTEPYNATKSELTISTSSANTYGVSYQFRAVSNAGNEGDASGTTVVKIDKDAPVISAVGGNPSNWTNSDATLAVTASDSASGLAAEPYSFDNGASWQASNSKSFSSNQTVNIKVKDSTGNISAATVIDITKIDKDAPVISSVSGNPSNWTNSDATLAVTASDSASGLAAEPYSFDNGTSWQASNSKSFSSNQKVNIKVKDSTGNISAATVIDITKIDKATPSIPTITYGTNSFKEFLNTLTFGLFFNDTETVTLTATDTGSGVEKFQYTIGGTEYTVTATNSSAAFDILPQYKGNISGVKAIDNAGNESDVKATEYFAVDNQKPTAPTVDANGYTSDTWTKNDVKITVSGASATSGIAKYQYSTDNGTTWSDMTTTEKIDATATEPYSATKAELTDSTNSTDSSGVSYQFRAVSDAANEGVASGVTVVKIDKILPVISSIGGNPSNWTNNDVSLSVTAADSTSGLAAEPYSFDNGATWQTGNTKSFSSNQTVNIKVKDSTGNISAATVIDITKIDKAAPSISTVSYGKDNFKEFLNTIAFGLFFNDTVTVTLTATDTGSGVKEFKYTIGGTVNTVAATSGSATFTVLSQYKGNISGVKAIDDAGNQSGVKATEYFAVDHQNPTAPTVDTNGYTSGTWTRNDVKITASGASATSGIAKYQYSTDNGTTWSDMTVTDKIDATNTEPYSATKAELTVSNDRNGLVLMRAVSNSGIEGETTSVSVKRDSLTPKLAVGVTGTVGQWTQDPITFTLSNTANNISPVTYWVKVGSDNWTQLSGNTCKVSGNVNTTYQFKAVSGSGLTSSLSDAYTVKLTSDALKEVIKDIDNLPDPNSAADKQITDNEQSIKDTKILFDMLSKDEQSAVGQDRIDKLNKLISRLNALLVIIPKDTGTGITAGNIGTSVNLPELNDPGVGKVIVRLAVNPIVSTDMQSANIAIATESLGQSGTSLVAAFDISLIKSVFDSIGNQTSTGKVSNSNIKGPITIQIPVPASYQGRTDLQVVYIDNNGNVTPLTTTLVTIDGVPYLQFTTTHFSVYAVTAPEKTPSVPNPNTGNGSLPAGTTPFLDFAILSVSTTIILRRRKKKKHETSI